MPICSSLQYYIYVWNLAREINDDLKPFVLLGAAAFRWSMWLHLHRNDLVLRKKNLLPLLYMLSTRLSTG
jgi:hypothetical protein